MHGYRTPKHLVFSVQENGILVLYVLPASLSPDWRHLNLKIGGALESWPNFQTPLLLMKLWDLLDNMCVVADLEF
jgi:hypothetical protein